MIATARHEPDGFSELVVRMLTGLHEIKVEKQAVQAYRKAPLTELRLVGEVLERASPPQQGPDTRLEWWRTVGAVMRHVLDRRQGPAVLLRDLSPHALHALQGAMSVVRIAPLPIRTRGGLSVETFVEAEMWFPLAAYAVLLLLDENRHYGDLFGCCKVCGAFFVVPARDRPGPPERTYCSPEHRIQRQRADAIARVHKHRAKPRRPR